MGQKELAILIGETIAKSGMWAKSEQVLETFKTVDVTSTKKRTTSKPGWGLVFNHNTGVNQHGELVFEFRGSGFIRTRAG